MNKSLRYLSLICLIAITVAFINEKAFSQPGTNLAYTAIANQSGVIYGTYGPNKYNDGIICNGAGNCYGEVTTSNNPDTNAWIELDWGKNQVKFDQLIIHVNNMTSHALSGATIKIWNGTNWINLTSFNFTSLSSLSYTIKFAPVITSKIRLTNLRTIGGLNPHTEEIEIRMSTLLNSDAGIVKINNPVNHIIPGNTTVKATIMNFGLDTLKTSGIGWSVDNNVKAAVSWKGSLASLRMDSNILLDTFTFTPGIHKIKVWTIHPNGMADSNNYNDTLRISIYSYNPMSGTYIIDNKGTGDFMTFNEAFGYLHNCSVSGSVLLRIKPGVYNEQLTITNIPGTSPAKKVTFESYDLDSTSVVISYMPVDSNNIWTLGLYGAHFITFRKMTILATGMNCGVAVNIFGGSDSNNICNNIITTPISRNKMFKGVLFGDWANSFAKRDNFNTINNNVITGGYSGVSFSATSASAKDTGNIISGNTIMDFYTHGIFCSNQDGLKITNNYFENATIAFNFYGIYQIYDTNTNISGNKFKLYTDFYMYGIYSDHCSNLNCDHNNIVGTGRTFSYGFYETYCKNVVFSSNILNLSSDTLNFGIYSSYENTGGKSFVSRYYNNFITCKGDYCASNTAYYTACKASIEIMNNSFYSRGSRSKTFYISSTDTGCCTLINNILYNNSEGFIIYNPTPACMAKSDYNDIYCPYLFNIQWGTSLQTYFIGYEGFSSLDQNSVSVDPHYFSPYNLHINTPVLNNIGFPVSYITTDIDGETRSKTHPDIGADEFNTLYNDAGISETTVLVPLCPGVNTLSVKIKNFGLSDLKNVKVNWSVNGILKAQVVFSTSLKQYQEGIVTLGPDTFFSNTKYRLKFWTALPNGSADSNHFNDTMSCTLQTALNGIYTIGASSSDYTSLNSALSDLVRKGVCSPVKFRIRPGTYFENLNIPYVPGASKINTITFESYDQDSSSVLIYYSATGIYDNYVINFDSCSFIIINELKLQATGKNYGCVINLFGNCFYNKVTDCILISPQNPTIYCTPIYKNSTTSNSLRSMSYNTFQNNLICGGNYGIYFQWNPTFPSTVLDIGNVIQNNIIRDFLSAGIYLFRQSSPVIDKNYIENSANSNSTVYGIYSRGSVDSMKIIRNKINLNGPYLNYGIYNWATDVFDTSIYSYVANNFISITGHSVSFNVGLYGDVLTNEYIYHNSISVETKATSGYSYDFYLRTATAKIYILNNIFSNKGYGISYYNANSNGIVKSNYNDLYNNGFFIGVWNNNYCIGLSTWKSNSLEKNSIAVDPCFYSSTDLHINAKGLDSSGTACPKIKNDIDGEIRNSVKPDIGADEFRIMNYDASVTSLVSPVMSCSGSNTAVSIRLKNCGCVAISNPKIKWRINGISRPDYTFYGTIPPYKDTLLVLGNYVFSTGINYTFKIWVDSVNGQPDQNHKNDTLIISRYHTGLTGTYTIGPSGRDYKSIFNAVSDLSDFGVCGPVTFLIDPGTYNEHLNILTIPGASATNTVTFTSANYDSTSVILSWAAQSSDENYVIFLNGTNWLRIKNITITAVTAGYGIVFELYNASNNIISNSILKSNNISPNSSDYIIYSPSSNTACNLFDNNLMQQGYYSIYMQGIATTPSKRNIFRNNRISGFTYAGIYLINQDSTELNGNKLISTNTNVKYGMWLNALSNSFSIIGNQIYLGSNVQNYALYMYNCSGKPAASAMIVNNFISIYGSNTHPVIGIFDSSGYYQKIYHNSVNLNTGSSNGSYNIYLNRPSSGTYGFIDIQNNILDNSHGGYIYYISPNSVSTGYLNTSNFNDIYFTGTYLGK